MMKKNNIPLDYRFQPTDKELINHYLLKIVTKQPPACSFAVNYCDLYGGDDKEPWKFFDGKSSSSDESDDDDEENELYFYTRLKKKTKNSTVRTERTVGCGTWNGRTKGTPIYGKDHLGRQSLIGMRKMFSYKNKGLTSMNLKEANRWSYVMHQYSLEGCYKQHQQGDEWVLCRIKRIKRKFSNSQHYFEAAALDTSTTPTTVDESSTDRFCNYDAPAIDNGASPQPINVDEDIDDGLCNFDPPAIDNGAAPQAIIVDEGTDGLGNFDAPEGINVNRASPPQAIVYESYDEFWNFDAPVIDYEDGPQPINVDEGTDGLENFDAPAGIVNGATPPQAIIDESSNEFWNFDAPVIDYEDSPQPINVDELMDELPDIDPAEIYIRLSPQFDSNDLMISWN